MFIRKQGMLKSYKRLLVSTTIFFFISITVYTYSIQIYPEISHEELYTQEKNQAGAPPRMAYLKAILPLLSASGCDTLLIEYEDMFPFSGKIANLSAKNSYTKAQIRTFLDWSHDLGLQVIPLVQTFGHLEYALKLKEFSHLRELHPYPQEICPSNLESIELIEEIIVQIMSLHKGVKYIHIGADEVFHLNVCSRCTSKSLSSNILYTNHVTTVAELIKNKYPGVRIIIWDDMIRTWKPELIEKTSMAGLVEPMVWVYAKDVSQLLPYYKWYWYEKAFQKIWIAGAFKGATLPTSIFPDLDLMISNQISWLHYVKKSKVPIEGFVLTGWSRYDHFAVLCELLPVSIPSLLLNLIYINNPLDSEFEIIKKWKNLLHCNSNEKKFKDLIKNYYSPTTCSFPGSDMYKIMMDYSILKIKIESLETSMTKTQGWMTRYNYQHNFTSPYRILKDYTDYQLNQNLKNLIHFKTKIKFILNQYFDNYVTSEWIEQKILPLEQILRGLTKTVEELIAKDTWPRRPLD